MTHSNIVSSLNAKANLSGANFTGNINAPIVDALNLREHGTNINTIYAYSSIVDDNKDISDQNFAEVQSMVDSGIGSITHSPPLHSQPRASLFSLWSFCVSHRVSNSCAYTWRI
jgi:hypothetical protein